MKTFILFFIFVSGKSKSSSGGGGSSSVKQTEEQNGNIEYIGDYPASVADLWSKVKLIWKVEQSIIISCVLGKL